MRDFYRNKNILLTGATGFLGLAILEKFLRTFPDVGDIYLIVRSKGDKCLDKRRDLLQDNQVFDCLKKEQSKKGSVVNFSKFKWIEGDLSQQNLGLTPEIVKQLQETVNIIIHNGATVRFIEPLKNAITVNISATQDLLNLATGCKYFEGFVYVSTLYSHARKSVSKVEETILKHPISPKDLIAYADKMSVGELEKKTSEIIQDWPNTYTYTKNAAENLVETFRNRFPVCIFRPGPIIQAFRHPVPYWMGRNMALPRVFMEAHRGYVLEADPDINVNFVPVDLTVNALLAATFDTILQRKFEIFNYAAVHPVRIMKLFEIYTSAIENYQNVLIPMRQKLLAILKMKNRPQFGATEEKILKEVQVFENFIRTSRYFFYTHFEFDNDHIIHLWDKMCEENKALCPFDLHVINLEDFYKHAYHRTNGTAKIDFSNIEHSSFQTTN